MKLNLSKVRRGDPIAPQNVNQFVDAFSQLANEFGFDLEISMDTSEGLMPQDKPTRSISNATGASLPHYSVVELTEMAERNPPVFKVEISSASPTQLGIVIEDVATGGGGNVIIAGHWYARYDKSSLPDGQDAAVKGDRFTGSTTNPIASFSSEGSIICVEELTSNFPALSGDVGIISAFIGSTSGSGNSLMVVAEEDLSDTALGNCRYINIDGTLGDRIELYAPRKMQIRAQENAGCLETVGFIGIDGNNNKIFIPAHQRINPEEPLCIQLLSADPTPAYDGSIWLREDLM